MKTMNKYIRKELLALSRKQKNILAMFADYILLIFSFYLSLSIRLNSFYAPTEKTIVLIFFAPVIAIPIFYFFDLYATFIRFASYQTMIKIMKGITFYTLTWFLIVYFSGIVNQPYDFLIINWMLTVFLVVGFRWIAGWYLAENNKDDNVIIYGAGAAGIQLFKAMKLDTEVKVIAFIDDNKEKQGRNIESVKIYDPEDLPQLIDEKSINEILIAMPDLSKGEINKILNNLKQYGLKIRSLPAISDLAHGRVDISDLKKVKIEDLLRREIRKPDNDLIKKDIEGKTVFISGAGGSIGSELGRQIIKLKPKKLILFDISEYSLYMIERELLEINGEIPVLAVIGNITRTKRLELIINQYNVNTIYHAAAYKHVPLVEKNTLSGLRCNVFGTLSCIQAAIKGKVESFVYISTDKAVRPTNIMGATKRFAELLLQAYAHDQTNKHNKEDRIRISMVRFGNVLGSSGSVVPLFNSQIKQGGPITVTDPNIIRYFMTITEAAQLVIQAGAMGIDGDIFVLDMGEPVEVLQLAKDMVKLSGMTIKDDSNPDGDIEIIYTGLRPGEKLFEELLIDNKSFPTKHKKIMRVDDKGITLDIIENYLLEFEQAIEEHDYMRIKELLLLTVVGFIPEEKSFEFK